MLIIPAENTVNWKRPPWVTLGLMLACVLVFLFYQGDDSQTLEQAVAQYLEADLQALEAPAYEDTWNGKSSLKAGTTSHWTCSSSSNYRRRMNRSGWPSACSWTGSSTST